MTGNRRHAAKAVARAVVANARNVAVIAASAVTGIGNGIFWPAQSTLIAGLTPLARRTAAFAMQASSRRCPPTRRWLGSTRPSMAVPTYPGLRIALPNRREIARRIEQAAPDAIHIATEGPIGWLTAWLRG